MKVAGYQADTTLARLMDVYGKTAEQAGPILANANYALGQIASALKTAGRLGHRRRGGGPRARSPSPPTTRRNLAMSAVVSSLATEPTTPARQPSSPALLAAECTAAEVAVGISRSPSAWRSHPRPWWPSRTPTALTRGEVAQLFRDAGYAFDGDRRRDPQWAGPRPGGRRAPLLFDVQASRSATIAARLHDTLGADYARGSSGSAAISGRASDPDRHLHARRLRAGARSRPPASWTTSATRPRRSPSG